MGFIAGGVGDFHEVLEQRVCDSAVYYQGSETGDGILNLTLKFEMQDIVNTLGEVN